VAAVGVLVEARADLSAVDSVRAQYSTVHSTAHSTAHSTVHSTQHSTARLVSLRGRTAIYAQR
jgi:hypothetical protein